MSFLDKIRALFSGGPAGDEHAGHDHPHEPLETAAGAGAGMAGATPAIADTGHAETDDEGMGAMSYGATAPDTSGEGDDDAV